MLRVVNRQIARRVAGECYIFDAISKYLLYEYLL